MSGDNTSRNITEHRHCKYCGKMIPPAREFCSSKCERLYYSELRRRSRLINTVIFLLLLAITLLIANTMLIIFKLYI